MYGSQLYGLSGTGYSVPASASSIASVAATESTIVPVVRWWFRSR